MTSLLMFMMLLVAACSSTSVTWNDSAGGQEWSLDSGLGEDTTSAAAQAGQSGYSSMVSLSTGGIPSSLSSSTGGTSNASQPSTGGSQAVIGGTTADAGDCLCPNNLDCEPKGAACNASDTQLGQVTDKLTCVRLADECQTVDFNVYCFEC